MIQPSDALQVVKQFVEELGLPYMASYGEPRIANRRLLNLDDRPKTEQEFESKTILGEYCVPVMLRDRDDTSLEVELYVDSQTGQLREDSFYRPTKEQVAAAMDKRRQHYIIVRTRNGETAQALADELFNRDDVASVEMGDITGLDELYSAARFASIHHLNLKSRPKFYKEKPAEDSRREQLKESYLGM